jgi:hypothetical protein
MQKLFVSTLSGIVSTRADHSIFLNHIKDLANAGREYMVTESSNLSRSKFIRGGTLAKTLSPFSMRVPTGGECSYWIISLLFFQQTKIN